MDLDIIYNDDCLEGLKSIPDKCIDLIITDPPYLISTLGGGTINKVKKLRDSLTDLTNADITEGYDIEKFNTEFIRVMKNINIYIWCNKTQIPDYFNFYVIKHKCKFDIICWHKTNALPTYSNKYLSDYEDAKTFYIAPINHKDKKEYGHPTIKPLDITEKFIRNSSQEGDIILDPFIGSGTTAVAAKNSNRHYIGYEITRSFTKSLKTALVSLKMIL